MNGVRGVRTESVEPERHDYAATICDRLEQMSWGQSAAAFLETRPRLGGVSITTLPVFAWDTPKRNAGRKSVSAHGGLLLPLKIEWLGYESSIVLLREGESLELQWSTSGGRTLKARGLTTITAASRRATTTVGSVMPTRSIPRQITTPVLSRIEALRTLDQLVTEGRQARWEVMRLFEKNLRWNFDRALSSIERELKLDTHIIDRTTAETLQNTILLGDRGECDSIALRLINRCMSGDAFARVDPQRYVRRALYSSAESAIRRYIGDPHIGRQVRRVADQIGSEDTEAVTEEFKRQNPRVHLGPSRAEAALTARRRAWEAKPAFTFGNHTETDEMSGQ